MTVVVVAAVDAVNEFHIPKHTLIGMVQYPVINIQINLVALLYCLVVLSVVDDVIFQMCMHRHLYHFLMQ